MSFSVDLWNGFETIQSSFSSNIIKLNQLIDILSLYSSHVKDFYNNLVNLYESTKESILNKESIFNDSLNLLVISFKIESEQYKNHYNLITKNINEIKEKIEKLKIDIDKYFVKNESNKEKFTIILNDLILEQENFNKSCKEFCIDMAEEEANKILREKNTNNSKKFIHSLTSNILTTKKDKKEKKENALKKVFEAKKNYINTISISNKKREIYNDKTEKILFNLEELYKDLLYYFEYLIKEYVKDKIFTHNEILESNRLNDEQTYKKINYKNIFNNFVERNATKEFPMNNLDFISFKLTKNFLESQKINKYMELLKEDRNKIFDVIKNYLTDSKINLYESDFSKKFLDNSGQAYIGKNLLKGNEILLDTKEKRQKNNSVVFDEFEFEILSNEKSEEIKEKTENFNFIKDFIFTLIIEETETQNSNVPDIKKEKKDIYNVSENERINYNTMLVKFMDLISPKNKYKFEYLNFFIKFLTINRAKGLFKLNPFVYQIFINIFTYILMNYKNSYDYVKNVILLAQTYYKGNDKSENEKIYLLNGLKNHAVFSEEESWHRAINYSLSLSIKNNNPYSLSIMNKEEYIKNLDKIAMNIIISYLYDMKISTSDENVFEKIKHFYSKIYKIDENILNQQINSLSGNFNKKQTQKKSENNEMKENKEKINED